MTKPIDFIAPSSTVSSTDRPAPPPANNPAATPHQAATDLNRYMVGHLFQDLLSDEKLRLSEDEPEETDRTFSLKSDYQKVYNKFLINQMAEEMTNDLPNKGIDLVYTTTRRTLEKKKPEK